MATRKSHKFGYLFSFIMLSLFAILVYLGITDNYKDLNRLLSWTAKGSTQLSQMTKAPNFNNNRSLSWMAKVSTPLPQTSTAHKFNNNRLSSRIAKGSAPLPRTTATPKFDKNTSSRIVRGSTPLFQTTATPKFDKNTSSWRVKGTPVFQTIATQNFKKNLYIKLRGRFGNVIFEFAGAYSMTLAAGCQKMFFKDDGQSQRFKMFFPKTNNLVNNVDSFPAGIKIIHDFDDNKYHPNTTRDVAQSKTDVFLDGFLGG